MLSIELFLWKTPKESAGEMRFMWSRGLRIWGVPGSQPLRLSNYSTTQSFIEWSRHHRNPTVIGQAPISESLKYGL